MASRDLPDSQTTERLTNVRLVNDNTTCTEFGDCVNKQENDTSMYYYNITRNELALLAHSFYTCLKHQIQLVHLTIVLFRSRKYGNNFTRNFILLKNSR